MAKKNGSEIWECVARELKRRKARTIVNIAGYLIAIGVLLTLLSFMGASKKASDSVLYYIGTHIIVYRTAVDMVGCCPADEDTAEAGEGFHVAGVPSQPLYPTLVDKVSEISGVAEASPYISYRAFDSVRETYFVLGGFDPAYPLSVNATIASPRDVVRGEYLGVDDRGVVMLHENYAVLNRLDVDDAVDIFGAQFTVKGIVNPVLRPGRADIYMHIDDAAFLVRPRVHPAFLFLGAPYNGVLVEIASAPLQDAVMSDIRNIEPGLEISTYGCYRLAARAMAVSDKTVWFLTLLILLAAVLFSMKTQFASVIERQHDIGILKAIGWPNRIIVTQVLLESMTQAAAGGVLGCFAAVAVARFVPFSLITGEAGITQVFIPGYLFPLAILFAVAGGVIAGIIPALSIARKYPAESLRRL